MNLLPVLAKVQETGNFDLLIEQVPYARWIGMACSRFGEDLIFRLPAQERNIGNPILPALHGGVIGGFMEMSAAFYLMMLQDSPQLPRIVDFSLDYLRAGLLRETYAECHMTRRGNRVANIMVSAWQKSRTEPIATARAHFLME